MTLHYKVDFKSEGENKSKHRDVWANSTSLHFYICFGSETEATQKMHTLHTQTPAGFLILQP